MIALRSRAMRVADSDFVRHGLLVFAGLMAANVLQFAFYSIVSRLVGVEQYGVLTSLFSAVLLAAIGPATVAGTIVARLAADLRSTNDLGKLRRLGDLVNVVTALVGTIAFIIVLLTASAIASYLRLGTVLPVLITGAALAFSLAIPVQRGIFQGIERFAAFSLSNVIEATTKVAAGSLLAYRFGVNGALAGLALSLLCTWGYNALTLRRLGPVADRLALDGRRIALTSTGVALAVLAVNALLFYDVILVRHYFSALTAGLYGAAALVARAMYTVINFIPTIVLPKASARRRNGRDSRVLLFASLGTAGAIVAVGVAVTAIAPRAVVIVLAGHAFGDAQPFVLPYMIALGVLALANVAAMYNIGLHRFDFVGPLLTIAIAEIVAVSIWHQSVSQILVILCLGHGLAFLTTLLPNRAPVRHSLDGAAVHGSSG